ncbi:MAG: cupin domain-containing protein [candidate division FCPU426 bacterium]
MRIENIKDHIQFEDEGFGRSVVITSDNSVLFLYTFKPGQAMTEHTHPFTNEYVTVIEGEALISVDVESVLVAPQQVVFIPRESVHSIHNHSSKPLIVASFMTPKP